MPVAAERTINIVPKQTALTTSTVSSALSLVNAGGTSISAGSATQPVYFSGGKPVACTTYANASVKYATSAGSITGFTSGGSNSGEHNANNISSNGMWYYTSNGPTTAQGSSTNDGALYSQAHSTT